MGNLREVYKTDITVSANNTLVVGDYVVMSGYGVNETTFLIKGITRDLEKKQETLELINPDIGLVING